jgi:hypothetical protein
VSIALMVACQRDRPQRAAPASASERIAAGAIASVAAASATTPSATTPSAVPAASAPATPAACATPDSFGAVPIAQFHADDPAESAAVAAAQSELKRVLERPSDYFVTVQTAGERVLVELWHRSAFTQEHCAARGADGKSRTYTYDTHTRRIVATKIW